MNYLLLLVIIVVLVLLIIYIYSFSTLIRSQSAETETYSNHTVSAGRAVPKDYHDDDDDDDDVTAVKLQPPKTSVLNADLSSEGLHTRQVSTQLLPLPISNNKFVGFTRTHTFTDHYL
jgi:Na+-transporting methylmalonyl-CoA/oxaloacetate decarboxylase gamma subunit